MACFQVKNVYNSAAMYVELFDYELPKELIAQKPHIPRDECRLLVCNRKNNTIEHRIFKDIVNYLYEDDLIVLNDTKVIPARVFARKPTGGKIEIFLLEKVKHATFLCLTKGKLKSSMHVVLKDGSKAIISKIPNTDKRIVEFLTDRNIYELLENIGEVPLPPYIQRNYDNYNKEEDFRYYQTVFAKKEGAVASPTAGLHFTEGLLKRIKEKGVKIAYVTLHVGIGTFRPVKVREIEKHKMHKEEFEVSQRTADLFNQAKAKGKRIIAVGTTVVRALESSINQNGQLVAQKNQTDIFIYPGYKYKAIDALITNFHLPRSTLLMLVSAFYDREKILNCYKIAIQKRYRFFSFGDAMFIY